MQCIKPRVQELNCEQRNSNQKSFQLRVQRTSWRSDGDDDSNGGGDDGCSFFSSLECFYSNTLIHNRKKATKKCSGNWYISTLLRTVEHITQLPRSIQLRPRYYIVPPFVVEAIFFVAYLPFQLKYYHIFYSQVNLCCN